MATCAEKKAAWQERILIIEGTAPLPLTTVGLLPDVLYTCEGAIAYAPLNPLGYWLPEVNRGTQKATGHGSPTSRDFTYLRVTGAEGILTLHGRRRIFEYEMDGSSVRIGPLGPYNCGPNTRFTLDGDYSGATVELVVEAGPNELPEDVDVPPPMEGDES